MLLAVVTLALGGLSQEHTDLLNEAEAELRNPAGGGKVSQDTIDELRSAVAEDPKSLDLLTALGYALLPSEPEEALKPLRKALRLSKQKDADADVHGQKDGDDEVALTLHRTVVETLMKLQRFEDAATVHAMYGYELDAKTHQRLSLKLTQTAETQSAVEAAQRHSFKAVEIAPTEPTSHLARGLSLIIGEDSSKRDEATSSLRAAFKLRSGMRSGKVLGVKDSTYPDEWPSELEAHARHVLGMLLASQEEPNLEEALESFEQATLLAPGEEFYKQSLDGAKDALEKGGYKGEKSEL